jgi:CheY-like chemotaxis protein
MKTRILIVEDEGLIALDLKRRLEKTGYDVSAIVDNAVDALNSVRVDRPALVLMDIHLSGPRGGIEAADEIRRQYDVPIVYVTAFADKDTLDRARSTGPYGYIVKPFDGIDFRQRIEAALLDQQNERKISKLAPRKFYHK